MRHAVPATVRAKMRADYGIEAEDMYLVPCTAQLIPHPDVSGEERQVILAAAKALGALDAFSPQTAELETAGGPSLISGDVPTVMRVVAWMCHEGRNGNGLTFVREELPAAAARITAPNLLVMDWNHSAVRQSDYVQRIIGTWYKADYAFDPKAKNGAGAWGILTTGIMWAWANPDIADQMLAEQARSGQLEFSMACIPTSIEYGTEANGQPSEIAHNPIFFTNSALDVPPADKDAHGIAHEGADNPEFERNAAATLQSGIVPIAPPAHAAAHAAADAVSTHTTTATNAPTVSATALEEHHMEELQKTIVELTAALTEERALCAAAKARLADITAAIEAAASTASEAPIDAPLETPVETPVETPKDTLSGAPAEASQTTTATETSTTDESVPDVAEVVVAETAADAPALTNTETPAENNSAVETESLRLTNEALIAEITELRVQLDTISAELTAATTQLATVDAEKATALRAATLEKRVASLPESVRRAYDARDDEKKTQLATMWLAKSDAEWEFYLTEELGVMQTASARRVGYVERSQREGLLPTGRSADDMAERVRALKK